MTREQAMLTAEEFHVEFDDTYMNVIRFGQGERVLVIAAGLSLTGLEGKGAAVAGDYAVFAEDYTVYLFDRKKKLPAEYSIHLMGEDIYRVLCELGVAKASFYGVSQGGMIVQDIALSHPETVEKLILCSTLSRFEREKGSAVGEWLEHAKAKEIVLLNRSFFKYVYSEKYLDMFREYLPALEQVGTEEDCERFATLAEATENFDVTARLNEIKCPVFVICDSNDKVIPPAQSMLTAQLLNCKLYVYDEYSHAVFDEAPDIKQRIYDFLLE